MPDTTPTVVADSGEEEFDAQVSGIAALADPVRRALYRSVLAASGPMSRDQAAEAVGVPRPTAKFHLDKLVVDGLLEVEFARPAGRNGPGAGRPAKLYRRSARQFAVSLPDRRYELAGRLLARAVADAQREEVPVGRALARAAREAGGALGEEARRRAGKRPSRARSLAATASILRECGYEPRTEGRGIALANCPFDALARDYTDVVCAMNLELIDGLVHGFDRSGLEATPDPAPGRCCVQIR
jgi:predicted ArsR family transcriptional regulator